MRRETLCFSMYSLISNRSKCTPKFRARAALSSLLPTPLDPVNKNTPTGAFGCFNPAYERLIAATSVSTASSWPKISDFSLWSRFFKFAAASDFRFVSGIFAILLKTALRSDIFTVLVLFCRAKAAPTSSMRSMALSGKNRSFRYFLASSTLLAKISSLNLTP